MRLRALLGLVSLLVLGLPSNASAEKVSIAAEVPDFDPEEYLDRKEARRMDRYAQLFWAATAQAMADSNRQPQDCLRRDRLRIRETPHTVGPEQFSRHIYPVSRPRAGSHPMRPTFRKGYLRQSA